MAFGVYLCILILTAEGEHYVGPHTNFKHIFFFCFRFFLFWEENATLKKQVSLKFGDFWCPENYLSALCLVECCRLLILSCALQLLIAEILWPLWFVCEMENTLRNEQPTWIYVHSVVNFAFRAESWSLKCLEFIFWWVCSLASQSYLHLATSQVRQHKTKAWPPSLIVKYNKTYRIFARVKVNW